MPRVIALAGFRKRRGGALPNGPAPHWFIAWWRHWQESLDRLEDYIANLMEDEMALDNLKIEAPANEPLTIATRTFQAPRALVWKVMTEPQHVARWWGTDGQSNDPVSLDVRPGGKWRIVSHDPDGNDYIFIGEYREVDEPRKFVWTFGMENMFIGKEIIETHTFEEADDVTHYKSVSVHGSIEDRDGMIAHGMEEGMRNGFSVMDRILAELTKG